MSAPPSMPSGPASTGGGKCGGGRHGTNPLGGGSSRHARTTGACTIGKGAAARSRRSVEVLIARGPNEPPVVPTSSSNSAAVPHYVDVVVWLPSSNAAAKLSQQRFHVLCRDPTSRALHPCLRVLQHPPFLIFSNRKPIIFRQKKLRQMPLQFSIITDACQERRMRFCVLRWYLRELHPLASPVREDDPPPFRWQAFGHRCFV